MKNSSLTLFMSVSIILANGLATQANTFNSNVDIAHGSNPAIAAGDSGKIHAVFEGTDHSAKGTAVVYCQGSDGGRSWTSPINVSGSAGVCSQPAIAVEKTGAVDVVWVTRMKGEKSSNVFFARSADSGATWTKAINISNTSGLAQDPAICIDGKDKIHVAWADTISGAGDIYHASSDNQGANWTKPENVSDSSGSSLEPAMATSADGTLHLVWIDGTLSEHRPDVYYSTCNQGSWTQSYNVSKSAHVSQNPAIACSRDNTMCLVWADNSKKVSAADIWCVYGKNGKFSSPLNISEDPGVSSSPCIASNNKGAVVISWADTSAGRVEIFQRIGIDGGFSNVLNISNTPGVSRSPTLTIVDRLVFTAWEEQEGSSHVIKLTSSSIDVPTGPAIDVSPQIQPHNAR